jgi:putative transposase
MSTVIQASTEIDLEDAAVARKESKNSDRELVGRLVDQARAEGLELVGENGLLPADQAGAGVGPGGRDHRPSRL